MTCLERMKLEHPELVDDEKFVVAACCPHNHGYAEKPTWCPKPTLTKEVCMKCWNREIPEESKEQFVVKPVTKGDTLTFEKHICAGIPRDAYGYPVSDSPKILDSGNRREFESGAVRDIQEGKGRCDLLPLVVLGNYMHDQILTAIGSFVETGSVWYLAEAIRLFTFDNMSIGGELKDRQADANMALEVAKHFEEGAKKYGDNNWRKGIPVRCYIDSAVRHYLKFTRGDTDEPHDRAFVWNLLCGWWTVENKPELCEYGDTDRV